MIDENKKAVKTVSLIMFATAFSKILGLLREMLMAYFYGGSAEFAAFATASGIPREMFDILLGAALLGVFIPVYNSYEKEKDKEKEEFANIFLNVVILATGLLAFFGAVFSEQIIYITTPGFRDFPEMVRLAAGLLKVLFPMIVFTGAVYTFTGILQSKGEFLAPALVSAVSNLGVMAYFLFFNKYFGIYGLAAAYLIAWAIQLLTLAVPLARKKYNYKFIMKLKNPAFVKAVKMAPPIMAGAWLVPVGMALGRFFLSFSERPEFYVSAFTYSMTVFLLVTGVLTHAICNYIFPKLAQNADDGAAYAKIVKTGLTAACFVIMPVACAAFVLRGEIVAVLFMRGEFTPELADLAARMFAFLAPCALMYSAIEILNRVFYAKKLVMFPMAAALAGVAVNFIMCMFFVEGGNITLAVLVSHSVTAVILAAALKKTMKNIFDKKFLTNIAKIILSSGVLLIIIKILYCIIDNDAFESGALYNILTAGAVTAAGACVYIGAGFILKTEVMIKIDERKQTKK